jgi:hypothetical protein
MFGSPALDVKALAYCHLSVKKYRFPDNLPRSQALSAHQLSRIKWRGIARTSFSYSSSLFRQTPQLIRQDI